MAGIGELAVFVTASTKKAQTNLMKFRGSMKKTAKGAKTLGTAIGALSGIAMGLSFAGLAMEVRQTMDEMDSLAKTSAKLGIASEQLAGLQHAAEQTGVSVNTLNMAMQRMVRRVSEASIGKGEAVGALRELGLSAELLNQQSPDVVLGKVADKLNLIENQSDKLRLAMKLFDSEGVSLVNTLQLGKDGLADMIAEAKGLRIAPTADELKKIEAANDAMDRAAKSIKGVMTELTVKLAPAIETAADKFSRKMIQVVDYWAKFIKDVSYQESLRDIARSGAPQERKDAAKQAALAVQRFREMGQHDMADKAQAALDFQLGSWMNELGGMTFKDGQKEIQSLAEQSKKTYEIWQASQQAAADAANKKAGEEEKAAQSTADNANRWANAIASMSGAAAKFTNRIDEVAGIAGATGSVIGSKLTSTLRKTLDVKQLERAGLQSAQAGTREEYRLRAQMQNQGVDIQRQQLAVQEAAAAEQERTAAATIETAEILGDLAGRLAGGAGFLGV